jgi:hypothetical protein
MGKKWEHNLFCFFGYFAPDDNSVNHILIATFVQGLCDLRHNSLSLILGARPWWVGIVFREIKISTKNQTGWMRFVWKRKIKIIVSLQEKKQKLTFTLAS